jgi:hypothetical protein
MALSKPTPVAANPPQLEEEETCPKYLHVLTCSDWLVTRTIAPLFDKAVAQPDKTIVANNRMGLSI